MPIEKAVPELWVLITEGVAVQLSVAVGAVHVAIAVVVVVVKTIFAGQAVKTGFKYLLRKGHYKV